MKAQVEKSRIKPAEMPAVSAALPIQLLRARESVMAWFRPHLQKHGLTDHQWRILRALAETDGIEMQELSLACEVQPPSLSRIMPKLVEQGLVRRDNGENDQRRVVAWLTPEGRRMVKKVSAGSKQIYMALLDAVGAERLHAIQLALSDLITILDAARTETTFNEPTGKVNALPVQLPRRSRGRTLDLPPSDA